MVEKALAEAQEVSIKSFIMTAIYAIIMGLVIGLIFAVPFMFLCELMGLKKI